MEEGEGKRRTRSKEEGNCKEPVGGFSPISGTNCAAVEF